MATLKEGSINITRNFSTINPHQVNFVYDDTLKEGDRYDLIQFQINELDKPYFWKTSIGVIPNTNEKEIEDMVNQYIERITEKDIKDYKWFLESGEKWGWD